MDPKKEVAIDMIARIGDFLAFTDIAAADAGAKNADAVIQHAILEGLRRLFSVSSFLRAEDPEALPEWYKHINDDIED